MSAFMTMITPSDWDDGFEETLSSFLYSRHALILEGLEGRNYRADHLFGTVRHL